MRLEAFDQPFSMTVVGDEILLKSDQANLEIVMTAQSAVETAHRLLEAARQVGEPKPRAERNPK
jgi:hypothetical protein